MSLDSRPFNVLIAGGGVAALETALALRELAGDRVTMTMLAPEPEFVYRPLRVREPFAGPTANHYSLGEIAADIGVELIQDAFKWLDAPERTVHTTAGQQLGYDALMLAMGARLQPRFRHALTIDDRKLDEQLHGLIQDVESGYIHKLVFIIPQPSAWPLPVYELALMTASRAYEMNESVAITIITPEDAPLAVLGTVVSQAVQKALESSGIQVICGTHAEIPEQGQINLFPQGGSLHADRVVALPELFGPSTPGVRKGDDGGHGFIAIDTHCRVKGLDNVFASGDATDFALKHGGIAAQQADVAAEQIAKLAGVAIEPSQFKPEVHGMLLGGAKPLYFSAHITGTHGSASVVEEHANWPSGAKIAAKYLAPYLQLQQQLPTRSLRAPAEI
jgi:sulfide:quinone oxidoreductase